MIVFVTFGMERIWLLKGESRKNVIYEKIELIVPERREEKTTEGGLDVIGQYATIHEAAHRLMDAGVRVSLFIAPCLDQIQKAIDMKVPVIEIHTGHYAKCIANGDFSINLVIESIIAKANKLNILVNAGHDLNLINLKELYRIGGIDEVSIGHAVIVDSLNSGFNDTIKSYIDTTKGIL